MFLSCLHYVYRCAQAGPVRPEPRPGNLLFSSGFVWWYNGGTGGAVLRDVSWNFNDLDVGIEKAVQLECFWCHWLANAKGQRVNLRALEAPAHLTRVALEVQARWWSWECKLDFGHARIAKPDSARTIPDPKNLQRQQVGASWIRKRKRYVVQRQITQGHCHRPDECMSTAKWANWANWNRTSIVSIAQRSSIT